MSELEVIIAASLNYAPLRRKYSLATILVGDQTQYSSWEGHAKENGRLPVISPSAKKVLERNSLLAIANQIKSYGAI